MAIIWADGFDHYGTSSTFLEQMGYTQNAQVSQTGGQPRTGVGCLVVINGNVGIRRALSVTKNEIGVGVAFMTGIIPASSSANNLGILFGAFGVSAEYRINTNHLGGINVYKASTLLGSSANNVITAGVYYWWEVKLLRNSGTNLGSIEVRINGVSVLTVTGITMAHIIESVTLGNLGTAGHGNSTSRYDDFVIWDTTGTRNNDFLGDRRCPTSFPNADTAEADWTKSTGTSGFALIDNNPPVDAQYIEAQNAGDISEFTKTAVGVATNDIAALVVVGRAAKSDAGVATYRLGINSDGSVENGSAESPSATPAFSYFTKVVELDPDGSIPWTRAKADAALLRVTRET